MAKNLKTAGRPAHINKREDTALRREFPNSHGEVIVGGLLGDLGRGEDDRITLLTPEEMVFLKSLGGSGETNPLSGLLEFEDGDGTGTSGGGGGEGGDNGVGGNDSGGPGSGGGGGGYGGGSVGGDTGFGDHSSLGGPESEIGGPGMGIGFDTDRSFFDSFDPSIPDSEIGFATEQPDWADYNFVNYAPKDTFYRALQEWWDPSLPISRFSPPTKDNLGFLTDMMGFFGFGGLGKGVMGVGAAMGRAQSKEEQEKSMAHNQALGSQNSPGTDTIWPDFRESSPTISDGLMGFAPQPSMPSSPLLDEPAASPGQGGTNIVIVKPNDDNAKKWAEFIWSGEINPKNWLL